MKFRYLSFLVVATALTACGTKPVVPVQAPVPPACTAQTTRALEYRDLDSKFAGNCIRVRGLVVGSQLYENGATYQDARKPHSKAMHVGLEWDAAEPTALKSHPQFVEMVGIPHICDDCFAGFMFHVTSYKIIPTAMD
ncbi:MAG: hypothetical protein JSR60_11945 [Proteobacteria bacterium]|nr:hypothetical protein [Pseudomonadota bacterium]